jgi:methionine sulfoxide reductase heme-binding subunit
LSKRWIKVPVFLLALVPVALLVRGMLTGTLGANPAETIQLQTGRWALKFLLISLAVTPVRRLTGWNIVIQYRRMLGLFAFFYACLHLSTYVFLDQGFDFTGIGKDIAKRRFVTVGFAAWCALVPLAVTSTQAWVKRLGFRRWKSLHRLAYLAGALACVHFIWRFKTALLQPALFTAVLVLLLAIRVAARVRAPSRRMSVTSESR